MTCQRDLAALVVSLGLLAGCASDSEGTLVTGHFLSITSDGSTAFFTDTSEGVCRIDRTGGQPRILVAGARGMSLTTDDQYLYYRESDGFQTGSGNILRVLKMGGDPEVLAQTTAGPSFVVDDAFLYVAEGPNGAIRRVPKSGGEPEVLVEARQLQAEGFGLAGSPPLMQDDTHLYWSDWRTDDETLEVKRVAKEGGEVELIATLERTVKGPLGFDGSALYFFDVASLEIVRVGTERGLVSTVGVGNQITYFVADEERIYWVEQSDGERISGLQPTSIVSNRIGTESISPVVTEQPRAGLLTADDDYLFWATHIDSSERGELRRARK